MFVNFGAAETAYCLKSLLECRAAGLNAELYPDADKMKKQFRYADQKQIPWVVLAGETEMAQNVFTLRNMADGSQQSVPCQQLSSKLLAMIYWILSYLIQVNRRALFVNKAHNT